MVPQRIRKRHPRETQDGRGGTGDDGGGKLEAGLGQDLKRGQAGVWKVMAPGSNECEGVG